MDTEFYTEQMQVVESLARKIKQNIKYSYCSYGNYKRGYSIKRVDSRAANFDMSPLYYFSSNKGGTYQKTPTL